jgi:hypothetical protein
MKRSYNWLIVFAILASLLCGCNDKDDTYWGYAAGAGSEAESEEYTGELTTTLVPTEVVIGDYEEAKKPIARRPRSKKSQAMYPTNSWPSTSNTSLCATAS